MIKQLTDREQQKLDAANKVLAIFAPGTAIKQEYDLASDEKPIWAKDVKQGYVTTAATDIDLPDELIFSQLPRTGYAAVTYVET